MKTVMYASIAALSLVAVSNLVRAEEVEPPVAINMEALQGSPIHVRERVLSEAQKGRTNLIQYLNRTQAVHQLRPQFLISEQQPVWVSRSKGETKVAERSEAEEGK